MDVSRLLATTREAAGVTQAELARRAGTSQAAVARYEAGTTSPSLRTLDRLVRAVGSRLNIEIEPVSSPPAHLATGPAVDALRRNRRRFVRALRSCGAEHPQLTPRLGVAAPAVLVSLRPPPETFAQRLTALRVEIEKITRLPIDVHATQLLSPEVRADAIERGMPL